MINIIVTITVSERKPPAGTAAAGSAYDSLAAGIGQHLLRILLASHRPDAVGDHRGLAERRSARRTKRPSISRRCCRRSKNCRSASTSRNSTQNRSIDARRRPIQKRLPAGYVHSGREAFVFPEPALFLPNEVDHFRTQPVQRRRFRTEETDVVDLFDIEPGFGQALAVIPAVIAQVIFCPKWSSRCTGSVIDGSS